MSDDTTQTTVELLRRLKALEKRLERLETKDPGAGVTDPTYNSLNVGAATGAAAGQIITSGTVTAGLDAAGANFEQHAVAGWGDAFKVYRGGTNVWAIQDASCTVAGNGVAAASAGASDAALILVMTSSGYSAMFWLNGSANHSTTLVSDPIGAFSVTANTAGRTNVYWSAANSRYEIQNKTAGSNNYRIIEFKAS